ncbi:MAG: alpha-glucan family phosphorylase [Desulfosalsimonadaceae bacterium]|nr:alpha-glucan family phosphorylase [Desulfosalsimonadaceae bacterium]
MSYIQTFQVYPKVPEPLAFAEKLVRNMWWSWNLDAIELIRRIDPRLWTQSGRNPIHFFSLISQKQLEAIAGDDGFMAHLHRVQEAFEKEVETPPNLIKEERDINGTVAYFSMEYGIHESLPLFAGGLGMLAGDHLKAASDRGTPLVAVGLLYRKGYFHQFMDQNGWQQEHYPETDLYQLPVERALDVNGHNLFITVQGPEGDIHAQVFKIMVGRIPLFLIDSNVRTNSPEKRDITSRLYVADAKNRLAQEILLGIGGMRALEAMGIHPSVCHLNEGHCSFVGIERAAHMMQQHNMDLKTTLEVIPRTTVFTTHTPVAAGHDEFPIDLVKPYLQPFVDKFQTSLDEIISLGQNHPNEPFSMFALGLRMSQYCNGVSELHGRVARGMWSHLWPGRSKDETPIGHITNGVHVPSWISIENSMLFERYLSPNWALKTWRQPEIINRIDDIYDEELWRAHEMCRVRLVRTCRNLMVQQYGRRNAPKSIMEGAATVLDHEALTIGFARRFATYKRAYLLLRDPARLEAILTSKEFPVQIILAGKAHPRDNDGKEVIRKLIEFAQKSSIRHRFIFLEDYDPYIARHLVQGCDVWLNTPRRPYEACGTSGIKAAANGVLNLSVLDGWWCEGYTEETGWRIGNGEEYTDYEYQDDVESQALYNVLENDVIPCFYNRKLNDTPIAWLKMMKASIKLALQQFCAHRMVGKYVESSYVPASQRFHELLAEGANIARQSLALHERLKIQWKTIKIHHPMREAEGPFRTSDQMNVSASVFLGDIRPDEVTVELCSGRVKAVDELEILNVQQMDMVEEKGGGLYKYGTTVLCDTAGRFGLTTRVVPSGDNHLKYTPGLITWA